MANESDLFSRTWNNRTEPRHLMYAVAAVFEELQAADRNPSSSVWTTNHEFLKRHGMPEVLAKWACRSECDEGEFPWSIDEVARTWEVWRKTNLQQRPHYCDNIGLHEAAEEYRCKARKEISAAS